MLKKGLILGIPMDIPLPSIFFKVLWWMNEKINDNISKTLFDKIIPDNYDCLKQKAFEYDENFVKNLECLNSWTDEQLNRN